MSILRSKAGRWALAAVLALVLFFAFLIAGMVHASPGALWGALVAALWFAISYLAWTHTNHDELDRAAIEGADESLARFRITGGSDDRL